MFSNEHVLSCGVYTQKLIMILRYILLLAGLATAYFVFTSNSGGPQSPLTGAPGETGTSCNMCHGGGSYTTTVDLDLMTEDSMVVNSYLANQSYIIRLRVSGTNSPKGYGFQLVSLDEASNSNMGAWSKLPSNVREITMLSRKYLVHSSPSASGLYYFHWTAPSTDKGNIKFYIAGLSANMNGTTTGDKHGSLVKTVPFDSSTGYDQLAGKTARNIIYPNPALNYIQTDASEADRISVFNLEGKLLKDVKSYIPGNQVDISELPNGLYKVLVLDFKDHVVGSQLFYKADR